MCRCVCVCEHPVWSCNGNKFCLPNNRWLCKHTYNTNDFVVLQCWWQACRIFIYRSWTSWKCFCFQTEDSKCFIFNWKYGSLRVNGQFKSYCNPIDSVKLKEICGIYFVFFAPLCRVFVCSNSVCSCTRVCMYLSLFVCVNITLFCNIFLRLYFELDSVGSYKSVAI